MNNIFKLTRSFSTIQKKLFTPGPLLVSDRVKQSLCHDYGSRDPEFLEYVGKIRERLLEIGQVKSSEYTSVLMQGSGTYGVEAALGTAIPKKDHKVLVVENGAYGIRIRKILEKLNINHTKLSYADNQAVKVSDVLNMVNADKDITHVSMVHSETTSGLLNPVNLIGPFIKKVNPRVQLILDAVSSFGAIPINVKDWKIDYLVSTSNKNLQGIPGFAFILANLDVFKNCQDNARSLALDAYDQWKGLDANRQFRFTPPTHAIKGFHVALEEFFERGGVQARNKRYSNNQKLLSQTMEKLGFKLYIDKRIQGPIITTFMEPAHPNWNFNEFYNYLSNKNQIIYPGKLTKGDSFRIGSIGEIYENDMQHLLDLIKQYLTQKRIPIPVPYK